MEIEPKYVDTAVIRWQEFTGRRAVLEGDGRTFNEVALPGAGCLPTERPTNPTIATSLVNVFRLFYATLTV
jgi:hypothetical protein